MGYDPNANYSGDRPKKSGGEGLVIEPGTHAFMPISVEKKKSKKDNWMLVLDYRLIDREDPDYEKEVREWIVLVPESWGYGKWQRLADAIDPSGALRKEVDPDDVKAVKEAILGQPFAAVTEIEEDSRYGDKTRIRFVLDEGIPEDMQDRLLAQWDDGTGRFMAPEIAATRERREREEGSGHRPSDEDRRRNEDVPGAYDDDDVPF